MRVVESKHLPSEDKKANKLILSIPSVSLFFFFLMICWSFRSSESGPATHCPIIYGVIILSRSWQHSTCLCVTGPQLTGDTGWRRQLFFSAHTQVSLLSHGEETGLGPHGTAVRRVGWAELQRALLLFDFTWHWPPRRPALFTPVRPDRHMILVWFGMQFVTAVWL